MNFNNPFHPLYTPFLQGINPFSPWIINSGISFPPHHYLPPPLTYPFHPHSSYNPFLIQQNNFYNSSSTSNTQPTTANLLNEKPWIQKERHDKNQNRAILVQEQIDKRQATTKSKNKIAEIIEIKDSDEQQIVNKQQTRKHKNLSFFTPKEHKKNMNTDKNYAKSVELKSKLSKNKFQKKVDKEQEFNEIGNYKFQKNQGGLRRSKRNSQKYAERIRKIFKDEMEAGLCPSQSPNQITQKIKQLQQNLGEGSFLDKQLQSVEFQRAVLPTFLNFQGNILAQSWIVTKKKDLLFRKIN